MNRTRYRDAVLLLIVGLLLVSTALLQIQPHHVSYAAGSRDADRHPLSFLQP
jgi:hypothetical protein